MCRHLLANWPQLPSARVLEVRHRHCLSLVLPLPLCAKTVAFLVVWQLGAGVGLAGILSAKLGAPSVVVRRQPIDGCRACSHAPCETWSRRFAEYVFRECCRERFAEPRAGVWPVQMTDRDQGCLDLIQENLDVAELSAGCEIAALTWGPGREAEHDALGSAYSRSGYSLVLGTDIIYSPEVVTPLFFTVDRLLSDSPEAVKRLQAAMMRSILFSSSSLMTAQSAIATHWFMQFRTFLIDFSDRFQQTTSIYRNLRVFSGVLDEPELRVWRGGGGRNRLHVREVQARSEDTQVEKRSSFHCLYLRHYLLKHERFWCSCDLEDGGCRIQMYTRARQ